MSKHTPGPWEVKRASEPEGTTEFYFTSSKGVIGYWKGGRHRHTDDQWLLTEEDANLIAAAPELLEACEALTSIEHIDQSSTGPLRDALLKARAAIARARGEA